MALTPIRDLVMFQAHCRFFLVNISSSSLFKSVFCGDRILTHIHLVVNLGPRLRVVAIFCYQCSLSY